MDRASALSNGNEGTARWSLRVLGGFELSALEDGERVALPGKRERVLLAYLALSSNSRISRRKLATLLWGDASDETALDNLRTCIWGLRKALGDAKHRIIASEGDDILLDAAAFEIDAVAFRKLAAQSGKEELEEAAKLYAGEFLGELGIDNDEFESWRREEAARFKDQVLDVLSRLMTQLAEASQTERAIEAGTRILRLEPLHETAVRHLMRLYGGSGRRAAAIQLHRTLVETLKTQLDAQPEAETRAVFAEITRGGEETPAPSVADAKPPPLFTAIGGVPGVLRAEAPPTQRASALGVVPFAPHKLKPGTLNSILAGGLAAAMAVLLGYQFVSSTDTTTVQRPSGVEAAKAASSTEASAISIAVVLPFVNMSGDAGQDFFSDGMTEEITSALAKVPDLRVVARTSAYQFRAQNRDIQSIGRQLHATHFIEGSVRKAGDRVRITVQLIKADDGTHIWAEDYDRQLTDIFAMQEDIATAIAGALRMPLGLKPGENLVNNRKIDPDSYDKFLRGEALYQSRNGAGNPASLPDLLVATSLLEQVVAKNPSYAPAWQYLGATYAYEAAIHAQNPNETLEQSQALITELRDKGEGAEQRALRLDSSLVDAYVMLGVFKWSRGKLAEGDELMARSVALDGESAGVLQSYSVRLGAAGRSKEAGVLMEKANALEPLIPQLAMDTAAFRWVNGDESSAIALAKTVRPLNRAPLLALIYAAEGNFSAAAEALNEIAGTPGSPSAEAVQLLRRAPARVAPQNLPVLTGNVQFVYAYVGAPERVIAANQRQVDAGFIWGGTWSRLWHPSFAAVRKTPQFKTLMQRAGFVDYWRAKGWPDLCHPVGADDFVCD